LGNQFMVSRSEFDDCRARRAEGRYLLACKYVVGFPLFGERKTSSYTTMIC
jgi:hypothetical protein